MVRTSSYREMFHRLLRAEEPGRAARTIGVFGWLTLGEGVVMLLAPHVVASVLHIPALGEQGANYFRLVGLLVAGYGTLYVVCGRLGSREFAFATLLDRPVVPLVMAVLWYLKIIPGPLALAWSVQDLVGFLWTFAAWRAER